MEERLERVERLLREVAERLERLERALALSADGRAAIEVAKVAIALALPPLHAARAVHRLLEVTRKHGVVDEVSQTVIESLASCKPKSITRIEADVRKLRGRASKHTIRKRISELEKAGIVVAIEKGSRKLYTLKQCIEDVAPPG
ncbi:MAG: hypothetical protein GXO32_03500 [Crenarchaeota archaeon]|nr:hypothetical protein [Thermoproteota archaeon]